MGGGGIMRTAAARAISSAGHLTSPIGVGRRAVAVAATSVPAGGGAAEVQPLTARSAVAIVEEECPPPRLVFGPVPTVEEAREAVSDLTEAIETNYFSSPTNVNSEVTHVHKDSLYETGEGGLFTSLHSSMGCSVLQPSAQKHVYQAFSFIQRSPEAQKVVASLASDPNVWDAILKNDLVMDFYKSHQSGVFSQVESESDDPDNKMEKSETDDEQSGSTKNMFTNFVNNVKTKISNMMSNISDLLGNFLPTFVGGGNMEEGTESKHEDDNTVPIAASFFALAVAAIMIILFKRI